MRIALGSDHAGYPLKKHLIHHLRLQNHECFDYGAKNAVDSVSYVPYGKAVAKAVLEKECDLGIVCCGTGLGVSIAANKHEGIRAALCTNEYMAKMAREHNDANVLALGARVLGTSLGLAIAQAFLAASYSQDTRHAQRIAEIMGIEKGQQTPEEEGT